LAESLSGAADKLKLIGQKNRQAEAYRTKEPDKLKLIGHIWSDN
jgi:hypothetical protein